MMLSCARCNEIKGVDFPLGHDGAPLLVDPTAEEPWNHLDFDPDTGNIVGRYELAANAFSEKGMKTVEVFQLDGREAVSEGYRRTFKRLRKMLEDALEQEAPPDDLCARMREEDDHGLLGWCLLGTGQNMPPFKDLRERHPAVWAEFMAALPTIAIEESRR